LNTLDY